MKTVHLVRYKNVDEDGIVRAFDDSMEADRFKLLLDAEKSPLEAPLLFFYVEELEIYNTCEEVAEMEMYEYNK